MTDFKSVFFAVLLVLSTTSDYVGSGNQDACERDLVKIGQQMVAREGTQYRSCKFLSSRQPERATCKRTCPVSRLGAPRTQEVLDQLICVNGRWLRNPLMQTRYCDDEHFNHEVQQNFYRVPARKLNDLVNNLFGSSYFYLGMVSTYERPDVALPGFRKQMSDLWQADQKAALDIINYVIKRGGFITLENIPRPFSNEFLLRNSTTKLGLSGVEMAREKNREILELVNEIVTFEAGPSRNDPHLRHFLEDGLMTEKVAMIKKLADVERRLGEFPGVDYMIGEYVVDTELLA